MDNRTIEKIYAGFLGMNAGMRIGAAVENPYWTYDRLCKYYNNLRRYPRQYKNFTADDDINGPVIFLRALTDAGVDKPLTAESVGEAWLNYTRFGRGMFWWGGENLSTEHRAYMNLWRGEKPPRSGSIELNGKTAAEQIGGEIFIDTWGLINPGNPEKAAQMARTAASVSHDGEGLNGAAFIAGCIAVAFTASSVDEILDAGLRQLPDPCDYRTAVEAVRAFHKEHPDDFRACRNYVAERFNETEFPGYCHIVPNGAICVLSMLYSKGRFDRAIEIGVMCGFDTDCNPSNVGTILGVFGGLDAIPEHYRVPINDSVVLSSVSGYLNMLDAPTFAKELVRIACELRGETLPEHIRLPKPGDLLFDFTLPGSTHGIRLSDCACHEIRWQGEEGHDAPGCLQLMIDGKLPRAADVSMISCFRREDFNEERYDPVFSPRIYPGQTVRCYMKSEQVAPAAVTVRPYVETSRYERIDLDEIALPEGEWQEVSFTLPDLDGVQAHTVGWKVDVQPVTPPWTMGRVYIDDITVSGTMDYSIDTKKQSKEFGQVTPFSFHYSDGDIFNREGSIGLKSNPLHFAGEGQAFTGNYYMRDGSVEADVTLLTDNNVALLMRAQGTRRYYSFCIRRDKSARIYLVDNGVRTELAAAPFDGWKWKKRLSMTAEAKGNKLTLSVDGTVLVEAVDDTLHYGMVGIEHLWYAGSTWHSFRIKGDC